MFAHFEVYMSVLTSEQIEQIIKKSQDDKKFKVQLKINPKEALKALDIEVNDDFKFNVMSEGSLVNAKNGKVDLGEIVGGFNIFQLMADGARSYYHEFPDQHVVLVVDIVSGAQYYFHGMDADLLMAYRDSLAS